MRSLVLFSSALLLNACMPLLVGGGGAGTVTAAAKEKGLSGGINDTNISAQIKSKLYKKDPDIHKRVGVNVQNAEVLLTGSLKSRALIKEVEEMASSTEGVKKVINEMGVNKEDNLEVGEAVSDGWITTRVKSNILFDGDIKSINYSIKTVSGVVYIMGIAQNQTELNKVLDVAKTTYGVKKVKSYVQMKKNKGPEEGEEQAESLDDAEKEPKEGPSDEDEKPKTSKKKSSPSKPKKIEEDLPSEDAPVEVVED